MLSISVTRKTLERARGFFDNEERDKAKRVIVKLLNRGEKVQRNEARHKVRLALIDFVEAMQSALYWMQFWELENIKAQLCWTEGMFSEEKAADELMERADDGIKMAFDAAVIALDRLSKAYAVERKVDV